MPLPTLCRRASARASAALLFPMCLAAQAQFVVPRAWDSEALSHWATPLAHDGLREGFFSEREYYESPVDNYRSYPVYDPDREPPGYWDSLKRKRPEPFIDTEHIGPSFDWVAAGKVLWERLDVPAMRLYDAESIALARSKQYARANRTRIVTRSDGTYAIYRWVVTPKGIALGAVACSGCHTRDLEDGTVVDGPGLARRTTDSLIDRMYAQMNRTLYPGDSEQMALYRQFGVPWMRGDIHESLKHMSPKEIPVLSPRSHPAQRIA